MIGKSLYQLNNSPFFNIPKGNNLSFLLDLPIGRVAKMESMKSLLIKTAIACLLSTSLLFSQNYVNYNLNSMVIQGEASGGNLISDDLGLGLGIGYDFPFANPRLEFALKLDYLWINTDFIQNNDPEINFMSGSINHFSATGGLNIYLNSSHNLANLYQPFRPYGYFLTGLVLQQNNLTGSSNFNLDLVNGTIIVPLLEIGGGYKVRINPHWSFNMVLGFRSTFSDDMDGIVGRTGNPDILGIVRIGVSKKI